MYGWRDDSRFHGPLVFIGQVGKVFPTAVAILTMAVLQITSLQKTYVWWNVILNLFCQYSPLVSRHNKQITTILA